MDSRRPLLRSTGAEVGYGLTAWTFEIDAWEGPVAAADPDGVVHQAALVHRQDALTRLGDVWWHGATVRYLRGELVPGSLVLERWHADGTAEELATVGPAPPASG